MSDGIVDLAPLRFFLCGSMCSRKCLRRIISCCRQHLFFYDTMYLFRAYTWSIFPPCYDKPLDFIRGLLQYRGIQAKLQEKYVKTQDGTH